MEFLRETYVCVWFLLFSCVGSVISRQPRTGCPETMCGNITIRSPFGDSDKCVNETRFLIRCFEQKAFLATNKLEVESISDDGELQVLMNVSRVCNNLPGEAEVIDTGFTYSKKNQLMVVGCNIHADLEYMLQVAQARYICETHCFSSPPDDGSCAGHGCCQMPIYGGSNTLWVDIFNTSDRTVSELNPCIYVFLVKTGSFNFSAKVHLKNLGGITRVPVLLDWTRNQQTCQDDRACGENSICLKSTAPTGLGFNCKCENGYEGNPNIPSGCTDIDECKAGTHSCGRHETCKNVSGSFRCKKRTDWKTIILVSTIGLLLFLMGLCCLIVRLKFRKQAKLREKRFEENGGIMLVQRLLDTGAQSSNASIKILSEKEIKTATKGYHESRILGEGGQGIVYKGILSDGTEVAIKRSRIGDLDQVGQFINELVLLSQISHPHVVRLVGCCLETHIPLLVYELISGGTLYDSLFGSSLFWSDRLRIAIEIAQTLAYLHFSTSVPIIHRDIKPANILLNEQLSVRLSDFGASRLVPTNREQQSTLVRGTMGYMDPEYLRTGTLSETSDVYSYGVVLMELVTREKALCFNRPHAQKHLVTYLESALKENRLSEVMDQSMVKAENEREVYEVALLAIRCTRVNSEERPDMRQVASELQGLRASGVQKHESGPSVSAFEIEQVN